MEVVRGLESDLEIINVDDSGGPISRNDRMTPALTMAAGTSAYMPPIKNMSVYKSKVQVGPQINIISVTNNEVVNDRILSLDLETLKPSRRCRGIVIICICWASFVACGIIALILCLSTPQKYRIDIGLNETWYLRRADWNALPAYEIEYMELPVKYVIFGHSGANSNYCNGRDECIDAVYHIQQVNLPILMDVASSYLVGGSGQVFEGRGANVVSAMVRYWNRKSITIMFVGNYNIDVMDDYQEDHVKILLHVLVSEGVLDSDYEVLGQCQIQPFTEPPGYYVMARMNEFPRWKPVDDYTSICLGQPLL